MIGDDRSRPKRIRLELLKKIVDQLQETLREVQEDLGLYDEVREVELVDLQPGSTGLVWEQETFRNDIPIPLAVVTYEIASKARGRPPQAILTARGGRAINDLAAVLSSFSEQGIRISVEDHSSDSLTADSSESSTRADDVPLVPVSTSVSAPLFEVDELLSVAQALEPPRWVLTFTATVQRLDRNRKLWFWAYGKVQVVPKQLSEDHFKIADSPEARWKRVSITATANGPSIESVDSILQIEPSDKEDPLNSIPVNDFAKIMQPAFDRLTLLSQLGEGWDTYKGKSIDKKAILNVRNFLLTAATVFAQKKRSLTLPFVAPISSGSLQLEWQNDDHYLELVFSKNNIIALRSVDSHDVEKEVDTAGALELLFWCHGGAV